MPIRRIVEYARAAPKVPATPQNTAKVRSAELIGGEGSANTPDSYLATIEELSTADKTNAGLASVWGNRKVGLAMNKTPVNAIMPARASFEVKGSCSSGQHA